MRILQQSHSMRKTLKATNLFLNLSYRHLQNERAKHHPPTENKQTDSLLPSALFTPRAADVCDIQMQGQTSRKRVRSGEAAAQEAAQRTPRTDRPDPSLCIVRDPQKTSSVACGSAGPAAAASFFFFFCCFVLIKPLKSELKKM